MTVTTSPTGLDSAQRTQLERLVSRARAALETDLGAQAEGRFGIHPDGTIEEEHALPDDASDRATRRDLIEIIDHVRSLGESQPEAVARLLREAAFTHLNRLLAIRIAEAIGLLPESLANGRQSRGFKDLGEIMPILGDDYWGYLLLCGDELAADAPALFDPRNPLLALAPSTPALEEIVTVLGAREAAPLWIAPDTLGWAYQFFNTADERRLMREGAAAPRTSRELAVRNQFFTPRYVVDFLVQNSLGRRLIETDPSSPLLSELPLLVDPPTAPGLPLDLDETSVLDPACGSGHFLLGCYDLLERAWTLQGVTPAESAPAIVSSLWGVDIDPRCAQVASAAIVLRARRHCRELPLPRPNIVTARNLPGGSASLPAASSLSPEQRRLVDRISEVLADAPVLGTLLKAEETLEQEIRHAAFGGATGTLTLSDDSFLRVEADLMVHLQVIADQVTSSPADRLLAAEADDALRLLEVVRRRYDVVLMNPPFGEPVSETKPYLRAAYPWMPPNLYLEAAFVGRALELLKEGGAAGAITSRSGFFLGSFEKWRREVILSGDLVVLADLGFGVMQGALVEAAAYVLKRTQRPSPRSSLFLRLLREKDKAEALERSAAVARKASELPGLMFRVDPDQFAVIPGQRISYWAGGETLRLFRDFPSCEDAEVNVRHGISTGDDFRFVRLRWEVSPKNVATNRAEREHRRWVPFAKGGEYSLYWHDVHLLLDWSDQGEALRSFDAAIVRNPRHQFRAGLTWPRRTASGLSVRVLPEGCAYGDKGPAIFPTSGESAEYCLGWLTSRIARSLVGLMVAAGDETTSGTASRSYEIGVLQRIPAVSSALDIETKQLVSSMTAEALALRASLDTVDEVSASFIAPFDFSLAGVETAARRRTFEMEDKAARIAELSYGVEQAFNEALGMSAEGLSFLDEEEGPHPASYDPAAEVADAEVQRLYLLSMEDLIDEMLTHRGGGRFIATKSFIADRRLELIAHATGRHPRRVAAARARLGLLMPEELRRAASDVVSYLVGSTFGRWDVRIAGNSGLADQAADLFDPVRPCSPGMLSGADGSPLVNAPEGYPLDFPSPRLLVDEPGHLWDMETAVLRAAGILCDDPTAISAEVLAILGRKTFREYFRRQFFKDHLSRYSKSRRKAPIYWPLSVPSKSWGVWLYAPMLSRETLYAVASEAARRERLATEVIARLQREQEGGGVGRPARKIAEELDSEEKLTEELRRFRTEAERIAALGWEPSLDDGVVLCAAPLADLFPAWPDARKAREELREGQHDWAAVAQWAEEL